MVFRQAHPPVPIRIRGARPTDMAQGADYVFKATEIREGEGLERAQTQVENAQGAVAAHQANRDGAVGSAIGSLGGVATAVGGLLDEQAAAKLKKK